MVTWNYLESLTQRSEVTAKENQQEEPPAHHEMAATDFASIKCRAAFRLICVLHKCLTGHTVPRPFLKHARDSAIEELFNSILQEVKVTVLCL
ncbi:hypothetical protein SKAU_G00041750 [Synaphobranchus kaupii]|uniref:Uncharacterized protein n=1 Tax=Synaphobranchus kaupii TaxID=118154 RepID=A0A9Q1G2J8_SYNKA|nr:hypothetical protein SKAU_G00041750 [Synaphobranchus kaupii]